MIPGQIWKRACYNLYIFNKRLTSIKIIHIVMNDSSIAVCPQIANCNHRRCSNPADNYCEWCQYEIVDKQYWRAYTRHKDGHMKECRSKL